MTHKIQNVRAVVFDLFGTLVHITRPRQPYSKLLLKIGITPEAIASSKRLIMSKDLDLAGVAVALGGQLAPVDLAEIEHDLQAELASIRLFPETLDVLTVLQSQGIKVGIASNLAAPYEKPVLALLPKVDVAVWSFRVGVVKPDAALFKQVIQGFGCAPAAILMVGDNPKNDVAGAKAMGLQALCINRATGRSESEIGSLWDVAAAVR